MIATRVSRSDSNPILKVKYRFQPCQVRKGRITPAMFVFRETRIFSFRSDSESFCFEKAIFPCFFGLLLRSEGKLMLALRDSLSFPERRNALHRFTTSTYRPEHSENRLSPCRRGFSYCPFCDRSAGQAVDTEYWTYSLLHPPKHSTLVRVQFFLRLQKPQ